MGKKKEIKEPIIPPQDKRICGGICICQFTIVISCVALVYLAVAVYMPSYRAFTYGMQPEPVMCQAVNTTMANSCDWASCGEWCLTKTSGFCPQIHVTTRRNGTIVTLEECTRISSASCPKAKPEKVKRYNCNNDTECTSLTGVFNCSLGHCANMSELFLCHNVPRSGNFINPRTENLKLNGFFGCQNSECYRFTKPLNCDRYCNKITTTSMNVFLQYGDNVYTGDCKRAVAHNSANGNEDGTLIKPTEIWTEEKYGILLGSCHKVERNGSSLIATDCINGTVVSEKDIPQPFINFTTLWTIVENSTKLLDPTLRYLPPQHILTIFNYSRLFINLEGCVNTLMGECFEFVNTHGNDGDNKTAESRFPCFYRKNDSFMVVARFDLKKTWFELMFAIFVPSSLFIVSFITLVIIGHSVHVGDDTKMRCVLCNKKRKKNQTTEEINAEMDLVMDGIIERTNAMADSPDQAMTAT